MEELLKFQINRSFIALAKQCLFLLENNKNYTQKLEGIIKEMNIDNLDTSEEMYQRDRKVILGIANDMSRDISGTLEKLDIYVKN
jgi:hypothetical protein